MLGLLRHEDRNAIWPEIPFRHPTRVILRYDLRGQATATDNARDIKRLIELAGTGNLTSLDPDRQEKLTTWDDVYNIKARIEGEFTDLREKVAEDVSMSNEATFLISLEEQTRSKFVASRRTPFSYWRSRVYCALLAMPNQSREAFRQAIVDSGPNPAEMDDLFFGQP